MNCGGVTTEMAEYRRYYVIRSSSHSSSRSGGGRLVTWHIICICCVVGSYFLVVAAYVHVVAGSFYVHVVETYVQVVVGSLHDVVVGYLRICGAYLTHTHDGPLIPIWKSKMDITLFACTRYVNLMYHNL
jgi:hypothetical protein